MSTYSYINEAFEGNLNSKSEKKELTFDVIKTNGKCFGFVTIAFDNTNDKLTKYEWEVCPQSSSIRENVNKGTVTDTNNNSFVFPIDAKI